MEKKTWCLFLICIVIAIDILLSYHKVEDSVYNTEIGEDEIITVDLNQRIVKQEVSFHSKNIEGLKVKTATFDRIPMGKMKVQILQEDQVLAEKDIGGKDVINNSFTNIKFDKKLDINSRGYSIVFDLRQISNATPITFYAKKSNENNLLSKEQGIIDNCMLNLQYYTHEFSIKRFIYILISTSLLLSYAILIIRVVRESK